MQELFLPREGGEGEPLEGLGVILFVQGGGGFPFKGRISFPSSLKREHFFSSFSPRRLRHKRGEGGGHLTLFLYL